MAQHPAAYAFKVAKVTISGTCFAGQEEWSTGFYLGHDDEDALDPGTTSANAIANRWTTFFTHANAYVSTAYKTNAVKVSLLNNDGDVDLSAIDIYDYPAPITGVSGGAPLPPQISVVATLTSDNQRGLASKGRMYLPGVNLPIFPTDPHFSPTEQNNMATKLKEFFDGVNDEFNLPGRAVLASKGHKVQGPGGPDDYSYTGGITRYVTGLRIGNVYDTQRRRRNDLVEGYVSRVIAQD
jgi:hypothetical protein